MEIHNTKAFEKLSCTCGEESPCVIHASCNPDDLKFYNNFFSVARLPINIRSGDTQTLKKNMLSLHYKRKVPGHYFNTGKAIEYAISNDRSYAVLEDKPDVKYILRQFHFHLASENSLDERFYPMECHFVHENMADPEDLLVVALLFKFGKQDISFVANAFDEDNFDEETFVDLSVLNGLPQNAYYNFTGTLTTPPFTGPLHKWFLFSADDTNNVAITITRETYLKALEFYQNNRAPRSEYSDNRYAEPLKQNYLSIKKFTPPNGQQ